MYSLTQITKKYKVSLIRLKSLLVEHNVTPIDTKSLELKSMVYLSTYEVKAQYFDEDVIDDILKEIPLRE